jgi:membrane-associated phospholipid phosphatase
MTATTPSRALDAPPRRGAHLWAPPILAIAGLATVYLGQWDRAAFAALNALGPATGEWVWSNLTILGDTAVCMALCLPLWRRRPDLLWALMVALIVSTAVTHGFKQWLDVERPSLVLGDAVNVIGVLQRKHSFPSGHSASVFLVAGILWLGAAPRIAGASAVAAALLAAISRSVVGAHWPSDVLGGLACGWLSAAAGLAIAGRTKAWGAHPWFQTAAAISLAGCAAALILGYDTGYPDGLILQRILGAAGLASAAMALRFPPTGG